MYRVFTAKAAILLHFQPIRIIFPVFHRVIISLFAIVARERYPNTHCYDHPFRQKLSQRRTKKKNPIFRLKQDNT